MHSSPCSPCPQSSLALTSSFDFSLVSYSQDTLTSLHAQLFIISFSWKLLSFSTSSSLTSPHPISRMLCLRSFIHFISLCFQASTATCFTSLSSPSFITLYQNSTHFSFATHSNGNISISTSSDTLGVQPSNSQEDSHGPQLHLLYLPKLSATSPDLCSIHHH